MSSPVTTWNTTTINGVQYLVVDVASFRIPLDWDPSSNMFIAVAAPTGGVGNFPALLQGQPGATPTFDETINLTVLNYTDPTLNSASLTYLGSNNYQANLTLHAGPPGADGTSELDPTAYGTPISGLILVVNSAANGFQYASQLCGDRYVPATILSAPAGNPTYTLASVSIPAYPFAWRPYVSGQSVVTPTGTNVVTNLVARLNNSSSGSVVGQNVGVGTNGAAFNQVLAAGVPAGSPSTYDQVAANASAVVYLNVERQSGTDTFTTSDTSTTFEVLVQPIPGTGLQP
jgi:hypothetical protein